jgi:hypothetical protein
MAIRLTRVAPGPSKAAELNAIANNGIVRIDSPADLADPNLAAANVTFSLDTFTLYHRTAPGVGADKWRKVR